LVRSLFEITTISSFSDEDDMSSITVVCVISSATTSSYSQADQQASSRRQAVPIRSRAVHDYLLIIIHNPDSVPIYNPREVVWRCVQHTSTTVGYNISGRVSRGKGAKTNPQIAQMTQRSEEGHDERTHTIIVAATKQRWAAC
jgi:hypothetical protein